MSIESASGPQSLRPARFRATVRQAPARGQEERKLNSEREFDVNSAKSKYKD